MIIMTEPFAEHHCANKDSHHYYIMYDPTTVDLMNKIGVKDFTVADVVEYLTAKTGNVQ